MYISKKEKEAISDARDIIGTAMEGGNKKFIDSYKETHSILASLELKAIKEISRREGKNIRLRTSKS